MPKEVLCSDAARTRETWERISIAGGGPEARLMPELYHADCGTILSVLKRAEAPSAAIVGHNPGVALFASRIVRDRPDHSRFGDYPAGATTIMQFDAASWADVAWHTARIEEFVVPREL